MSLPAQRRGSGRLVKAIVLLPKSTLHSENHRRKFIPSMPGPTLFEKTLSDAAEIMSPKRRELREKRRRKEGRRKEGKGETKKD